MTPLFDANVRLVGFFDGTYLFDLDNATNDRLRGESGLLPGIGVDELVFGVPNFRILSTVLCHAGSVKRCWVM